VHDRQLHPGTACLIGSIDKAFSVVHLCRCFVAGLAQHEEVVSAVYVDTGVVHGPEDLLSGVVDRLTPKVLQKVLPGWDYAERRSVISGDLVERNGFLRCFRFRQRSPSRSASADARRPAGIGGDRFPRHSRFAIVPEIYG
jgi:hypothetical protein